MITKIQAIQSLVPGAEVSVGIYNNEITWVNPRHAPVTDEEIVAEQKRLQGLYDWNEYQRNRASEYPTIEEQLDALYHAGLFPPAMTARIRAVKEKYPAPSTPKDEWLKKRPVKLAEPTVAWTAPPPKNPVKKQTREQWLSTTSAAVQQPKNSAPVTSVTPMTREQWLAQQQATVQTPPTAKKPQPSTPVRRVAVTPMTKEQWLAEQAKGI